MLALNENLVLLDADVSSAEEAIRKAGKLLVKEGKVKSSYVEAMVKGFHDVGPYIVVAPNIAFPHARPEHGVNEKCVSIVRLKNPVEFGHSTNDPVKLVCAIGGTDNADHLQMLQELSGVLGERQKVEKLLKATNYEEFIGLFNHLERMS